nr:hypothetical protein GCM10020185_25060 [Pseudomonas brassicacearum subsp. brassicacearum]
MLSSWRYRVQPLLVVASTWLVYGMAAGLTEGGGILSRPKEHWFLLWIPLALIAALSINYRARRLLVTPVQRLTPQALDSLASGAQVIESDGLGPKVLRLEGEIFSSCFAHAAGTPRAASILIPSALRCTANNCKTWEYRARQSATCTI